MVLEFLGEEHSKEKLMDLVDSDKSGITWTMGLAKTTAQLGFKTEFYTKSLELNTDNYDLDFFKEEADDLESSKEKLEKLKEESQKFGVHKEEKILSLNEILLKINENCIAIILLDWSKINKTDKFIGHFVPIIGYDDESIYIHNQGIKNGDFIKIKRELFDESRKSKGTDEDIVFIYRK